MICVFIVSLSPLECKLQKGSLVCSVLFYPQSLIQCPTQPLNKYLLHEWVVGFLFSFLEDMFHDHISSNSQVNLFALNYFLQLLLGLIKGLQEELLSQLWLLLSTLSPTFFVFLAILATERPRDLIITLAEPRYTVSVVFSEHIQFSNPIKNGNEFSLAGNKVSLATDGETLNNVGVNSVS